MAVMNKDLQRAVNRNQIIRKILERSAVSRAELARELGMYRSTVSNLVDQLLEEGWIRESDALTVRANPGRRAQGLSINKGRGIIIGLALKRDDLYDLVVSDPVGDILLSETGQLSVPHSEPHTVQDIMNILSPFTSGENEILGMGVSVPGFIDTKNQHIIQSKIPSFGTCELSALLERDLPFPILIENDSRCCAWGKAWRDHRFEKTSFVYLYMTGMLDLGMGLFVDGDILYGAHNHSGEFSQRFERKVNNGFKEFLPALLSQPPKPDRFEREEIRNLIRDFLDIIYILDPARIYLGTGFEAYENFIKEFMRGEKEYGERLFDFARMGEKEAAYGAAAFILTELFRTPDESILFQSDPEHPGKGASPFSG